MITEILQSYLSILILIATISSIFFFVGIVLIFRKNTTHKPVKSIIPVAMAQAYKNGNAKLITSENDSTSLSNFSESGAQLRIQDVKTDYQAIAGETIFATQLDLARAYIETGHRELAKQILHTISAQGSAIEQQEAQQLLALVT